MATRIAHMIHLASSRAGLVLLAVVVSYAVAPRLTADEPQPVSPVPVAATPAPVPSGDARPEAPKADVPAEPKVFKRPGDFTPLHRVIVGRNDKEIRKPGTLLQSAAGSIARVDQRDLYNRSVALRDGQRIFSSLTYVDRPNSASISAADAAQSVSASPAPGSTSWLLLLPLGGLVIFYIAIRFGLLDRKSPDDDSAKPRAPRLKVTLSNE